MGKKIDLTGKRFGRLLVIKQAVSGHKTLRWECLCDCGNIKSIAGSKLRSGNTRSCRCLDTEMTIERTKTHGRSKTPEHWVWKTMRQRCNNPKQKSYADYGGRGIRVCERWDSFDSFLEDMGERPNDEHQIERIDNNRNYEPSNCKWALRLEQANNKRNNHRVTYKGKTQTITQWADEIGIKRATLYRRLTVYKTPINIALTKGQIRWVL